MDVFRKSALIFISILLLGFVIFIGLVVYSYFLPRYDEVVNESISNKNYKICNKLSDSAGLGDGPPGSQRQECYERYIMFGFNNKFVSEEICKEGEWDSKYFDADKCYSLFKYYLKK